MANAAPAVAFPAPEILEAERDFRMQLVDGSVIDGYVRRRSDPEFPIVYCPFQLGPPMAVGKGVIYYGIQYNRVAQGRYELDVQKRVAVIKTVNKSWLRNNPRENIMSEISVAQTYGDNFHIGSILDALEDDEHYYIIMPFWGFALCDYLDAYGAQPQAPPEVTRSFVENLAFLKRLGILHCDISAENIMVSRNDERTSYPLIDFAMAKQSARDEHGQFLPVAREIPASRFGKFQYMSPEMHDTRTPGNLYFGVDMWAIGCTLFLLWTGNYLYERPGDACWRFFVLNDDSPVVMITERVQVIRLLFEGLLQQQQNLLNQIFIRNPEDRVTVDDILNDPYFIPIE